MYKSKYKKKFLKRLKILKTKKMWEKSLLIFRCMVVVITNKQKKHGKSSI